MKSSAGGMMRTMSSYLSKKSSTVIFTASQKLQHSSAQQHPASEPQGRQWRTSCKRHAMPAIWSAPGREPRNEFPLRGADEQTGGKPLANEHDSRCAPQWRTMRVLRSLHEG